MKLSEANTKLKEKQETNKKKLKKASENSTQIIRQATLLDKKSKEIGQLRMEVNSLQMKLQERERVHTQNRDLVTKNCAQQSQIENYKRQIQAL